MTGRSVPEWRGTTPDTPAPPRALPRHIWLWVDAFIMMTARVFGGFVGGFGGIWIVAYLNRRFGDGSISAALVSDELTLVQVVAVVIVAVLIARGN